MLIHDAEQLLTGSEAARLCGLTYNHFKYYVTSGKGPPKVPVGENSHAFYRRPDVECWRDARSQKTKNSDNRETI